MRKIIVSTALMLGMTSTSVVAQSVADQVISQLSDQGYTYFEVKNGVNQVKIEAIRGSEEVEYVYDLRTGELLKAEAGPADARDQGRSGIEVRDEPRDFVGGRDDDDDDRRSGRDDDDDDDDRRSGRDDDDDDDDDEDDDD